VISTKIHGAIIMLRYRRKLRPMTYLATMCKRTFCSRICDFLALSKYWNKTRIQGIHFDRK